MSHNIPMFQMMFVDQTAHSCIDSVQVPNVVKIKSVSRIYRHAGDYKAGNTDSWYFQVYIQVPTCKGHMAELSLALHSFRSKGMSLVATRTFLGKVAAKGEINTKYWYCLNKCQ